MPKISFFPEWTGIRGRSCTQHFWSCWDCIQWILGVPPLAQDSSPPAEQIVSSVWHHKAKKRRNLHFAIWHCCISVRKARLFLTTDDKNKKVNSSFSVHWDIPAPEQYFPPEPLPYSPYFSASPRDSVSSQVHVQQPLLPGRGVIWSWHAFSVGHFAMFFRIVPQ